MTTPEEIIRRVTQRAMERHRLSEAGLARCVGCSPKTVNHLLCEEPVRMTQEQFFNVCSLAGIKF